MADTSALAGWTPSGGATLELTEWPDLICGYDPAALMVRMAAGGGASTAFAAVDVSKATGLALSLASFRRATGPLHKASDAAYAVDLTLDGSVIRYLVPTYRGLTRVLLPLDGASELTGLAVIALHDGEDQLVVSGALAVADEAPLDLLLAVKAGLERERDLLFGRGRRVGTMTCSAGDSRVTVDTDWSWMERYAVFSVGEGDSLEVHQADNAAGGEFTLGRAYGGPAMLHDHDGDPVYLTFPVEVGRFDVEVRLPGLCVWFTSPSPTPKTGRLAESVSCFKGGEAVLRRDGARVSWRVMIDHEARSPELIADMTQACRNFLAGGVAWVHGIRYWFEWSEPAVDAEPDAAYDVIPKSAYALTVETREDSWQARKVPQSEATSLSVRPLP